ncbi:cupin domain-containing protein [bacterium]|nr:cupin domain-containing protein [bacterium]
MRLSAVIVLLSVSAAVIFAGGGHPQFVVKKVSECPPKAFGGGFEVREVLHPKNEDVNPGFSTAYITLGPHQKTKPHKLAASNQVFFVLEGEADLHIGDTTITATPGMAIYIAPDVWHWAENNGDKKFVFLCIVSPPWYQREEIIEGK